jgi:hypothetical protein
MAWAFTAIADSPVKASIVALMQAVSAGRPVLVKDNVSWLVITQRHNVFCGR